MNEIGYEKLSRMVKALEYQKWNIPLNEILTYTGCGKLAASVELDHTYICRVNENMSVDKSTIKIFKGFADLPNKKLSPMSLITMTDVINGDTLSSERLNTLCDTERNCFLWTNIGPVLAILSKNLGFLDRKICPIDHVFIQDEAYQILESANDLDVSHILPDDCSKSYMMDIGTATQEETQFKPKPIEPLISDLFIKSDRILELHRWLQSNVQGNEFLPEESKQSIPEYLNKNSPCYSPKLAAAVNAWLAVNSDDKYHANGKTVKQNIEQYLEEHAEEYGLTKTAQREIAKVANWKPKGGAPETPS